MPCEQNLKNTHFKFYDELDSNKTKISIVIQKRINC